MYIAAYTLGLEDDDDEDAGVAHSDKERDIIGAHDDDDAETQHIPLQVASVHDQDITAG